MANLGKAFAAVDRVFDALVEAIHVRGCLAGVTPVGDGNGLHVTLPDRPEHEPPKMMFGVPIDYVISESRPETLGSAALLAKVRARRANR